MSLRARLVLGMLALTALGLLVAGAVTYAEQKSFLQDRVDQQARAALPSVSRELDEQGRERSRLREPARVRRSAGAGRPGQVAGPGAAVARMPRVNLPPGTYGQRRDASGEVLGNVVLSYGEEPLAGPAGSPRT